MLHHAGVSHAEIIICSLPNMVLKGANNLKILRQIRELNPHGANHRPRRVAVGRAARFTPPAQVTSRAPRLLEAADLLHALEAAEKKALDHKRGEQEMLLKERNEVIS